jgi:hypothetical protein
MDNNVVKFSPRPAMAQIVFLAERVADIISKIDEISTISDADRQSLLWCLSLIRELAAERKEGLTPGCVLPKFPRAEDRDPDGAA